MQLYIFNFCRFVRKKLKKKTGDIIRAPDRNKEARIYLLPPVVERADGGGTDKDSDNSDDPEGLPHHLPQRILGGPGELNEGEDQNDPNDINPREWSHKDTGYLGTKIPECIPQKLSAEDQLLLQIRETAFDFYELFLVQRYTEEAVYHSRLYAVKNDFNNHIVNTSGNDFKLVLRTIDLYFQDFIHFYDHFILVRTVRCLEAVLLFSGYNRPPPDTQSRFVSSAVRRDEIDSLVKCLHLRDNTKIDNDGYYKVRHLSSIT